MTIVNHLSYSNRRRGLMANYRIGFTYVSFIFTLSFALLIFAIVPNPIHQFRYLLFICLLIGVFTCVYYIVKINEPKLSLEAKQLEAEY